MEVQVDSPGGLRRQMRVRVPADEVAKAIALRLNRAASRAKLPGFRPGKAPRKVIKQQFGESARMEAIPDLVQPTYSQALRERKSVTMGKRWQFRVTCGGRGILKKKK